MKNEGRMNEEGRRKFVCFVVCFLFTEIPFFAEIKILTYEKINEPQSIFTVGNELTARSIIINIYKSLSN